MSAAIVTTASRIHRYAALRASERESSAHYAEDIASAETFLRAALSGMQSPSAMLLLHPRGVGSSAAVSSGAIPGSANRELEVLRSPSHALALLAQFYGLPVAWPGAHGAFSLAATAMALLQQRISALSRPMGKGAGPAAAGADVVSAAHALSWPPRRSQTCLGVCRTVV